MEGKRLGGYVLRQKIGAGGMGTVYAGEHELLRRPVAIKVLLPELAAEPTMLQRFINEARAAAAVKHPGIVTVFDVAQDGELAYIAMELLEGQTLGQRLAAGRPRRQAAFAIAAQIADALAAAHALGIVHRDLKPDNVFLLGPDRGPQARPSVKLLDFGVAKLMEADVGVTGAGMIIGTPSYMSPEQWSASPVDLRTDVYGLGCIVFAMLVGRPPFVGSRHELMSAHLATTAPRLSKVVNEVPRELDELVARMLAKLPADRPQSAAELVPLFERLEQLAGRSATVPLPQAPGARTAGALPRLSRAAVAEASRAPATPPVHDRADLTIPDPPKLDRSDLAPMEDGPPERLSPRALAARAATPIVDDSDLSAATGRIDISEDADTHKLAKLKEAVALADALFRAGTLEEQDTVPRPVALVDGDDPAVFGIGTPADLGARGATGKAAGAAASAAPPSNSFVPVTPAATAATPPPIADVPSPLASPGSPAHAGRWTLVALALAGSVAIASAVALLVHLGRRGHGVSRVERGSDAGSTLAATLVQPDAGPAATIDATQPAPAPLDASEPIAIAEDADTSGDRPPAPVPRSRGRTIGDREARHDPPVPSPTDAAVDAGAPDTPPAAPPPTRSQADYAAELAARQRIYEADPSPGQLLKLGDAAVAAGQQTQAIYYYRLLLKQQPNGRDAFVAQQRLALIRRAIQQSLEQDKARREQTPAPP